MEKTHATLEKTYNPQAIESKWYQYWEKNDLFSPSGNGEPYCIMIPPPNVTGILHMGHAFQNSIIDALIRYQRMRGNNTLWQVGTDHAGISTQMVVERKLLAQNISRHDLGRDEFVNRVWEWKAESGGNITQQLRRLGASTDWSRERFTMDPGLSHAVQTVFIQLYREGLIYRGQKLVNWDPVLKTAISDLEVITEEESGSLWHISYPLADAIDSNITTANLKNTTDIDDQSGSTNATSTDSLVNLVVATTRPETMLGDVAVAVHPDDLRYKHLIGKQLKLPLCDRLIPIIADAYVDPTFGTGCVKITPAHDFNDYAIGERHNLPKINILTADAKINTNAPIAYQGLDRFAARKQILADLTAQGFLAKTEAHTLKIPRGDQTKAIIEPYLTNQWFVKIESLAKPAIAAVENGDINFVPENWTKTYFEWMRNIHDWCISRQLWWGHRIPAWYDANGNTYVGESDADVRAHYKLGANIELTQEEDVLDTWFSSALWPFSTLGWPEKTEFLNTFYPTNVLVTGFDIIFFWVARMIMFGLKFTGKVPFKTVYIHGLIQDHTGQKMSKSKGNVLDPIDMIDGISLEDLVAKRISGLMQPQMAKSIEQNTRKQFPDGIPSSGTDALRFTFYSLATTGRHIKFETSRLETYRNFCNKLWNASRYVLMNMGNVTVKSIPNELPVNSSPTATVSPVTDLNITSVNAAAVGAGNAETTVTAELSIADKWILSLWQQVKVDIIEHMEKYRFDLVAQDIYEFVWNEYCDWYLELSKPILFNQSSNYSVAELQGTRNTLVTVLEEILRVVHPFMPFITEEIWQLVAPYTNKISNSLIEHSFPLPDTTCINHSAEQDIAWLKTFTLAIRNIRGEMNISPGKLVPVLLRTSSTQELSIKNLNVNAKATTQELNIQKLNANTEAIANDAAMVANYATFLKTLAKIESISWLDSTSEVPQSATALVGNLQILIPLHGVIDIAAESARLMREINKITKDLAKTQVKLDNPDYLNKAPAEVVAKERLLAADLNKSLASLTASLQTISTGNIQ